MGHGTGWLQLPVLLSSISWGDALCAPPVYPTASGKCPLFSSFYCNNIILCAHTHARRSQWIHVQSHEANEWGGEVVTQELVFVCWPIRCSSVNGSLSALVTNVVQPNMSRCTVGQTRLIWCVLHAWPIKFVVSVHNLQTSGVEGVQKE